MAQGRGDPRETRKKPGRARSKSKGKLSCSQTAKVAYANKADALAACEEGETAERCARDRGHWHVISKRGKGRNR